MPRYELAYILAAQVSDDQVAETTNQIKKIAEDLGAKSIDEQNLGKRKLAYPIKKTRNGYYLVLTFDMDANRIGELDAKLRTQTATIVRHLILNLDEHLAQQEKDKIVQAKLSHSRAMHQVAETESKRKATKTAEADEKMTLTFEPEDLDKKIEEALTADITK